MSLCWNCNSPLTNNNSSKEHIIPEAIGGVKSSTMLLCKKCNEVYGSTIDAELASNLRPLLVFLELGNHNTFRADSVETQNKIEVYSDASTGYVNPIVTEENNRISIQASDKRRVYNEIRRILKQGGKDVALADEWIKQVTRKNEKNNDKYAFDIEIGNEIIFRSIAKIALNYYLSLENPLSSLGASKIVSYIQGNVLNDFVWYFYLIEDTDSYRRDGEVFDIITITGDSSEQIIYAYVDILHLFRYVVVLSEEYQGDSFQQCYFYNPKIKREENGCLHVKLAKDQICWYIRNKPMPSQDVLARVFAELQACLKINNQPKKA